MFVFSGGCVAGGSFLEILYITFFVVQDFRRSPDRPQVLQIFAVACPLKFGAAFIVIPSDLALPVRQAFLQWGALTWPGELDLAPDAMHDAIKETGLYAPGGVDDAN
jgi:hypothetical protein